jgi:hypothetical protein
MHPQDIAELHGDGCRNEYQRAFEVSRQRRQPRDDRAHARNVARELGRYVVVTQDEVHCSITDAILGCDYAIDSIHQWQDLAVARATELCAYSVAFVFTPEPDPAPPAAVEQGMPEDYIPF